MLINAVINDSRQIEFLEDVVADNSELWEEIPGVGVFEDLPRDEDEIVDEL